MAPPPYPPPTSLHSGARERGPGGGREHMEQAAPIDSFLLMPSWTAIEVYFFAAA
jgi:hypothetical protein